MNETSTLFVTKSSDRLGYSVDSSWSMHVKSAHLHPITLWQFHMAMESMIHLIFIDDLTDDLP